MKLRCPACKNVMTIDDDVNEKRIRCSQCEAVLDVPNDATAMTAEAPAPSPAKKPDAFADREVAEKVKRPGADASYDDDPPARRRRGPRRDARESTGSSSGLLIAGGIVLAILVVCVLPAGVAVLRTFVAVQAIQEDMAAMPIMEGPPPEWMAKEEELNAKLPGEENPPAFGQIDRLDAFIEKNLGPNDQAGALAPDSPLWAKIKLAGERSELEASPLFDGRWGNVNFRETAPDGGVLIGFFGSAPDNGLVHCVQPIYLTPKGEIVGKRYGAASESLVCVKAKPRYAVGAIQVRGGDLFDGFRVTFMKVEGDRLNPKDAYDSIQIGGNGGNPSRVGGDGKLIVGIHGRCLAGANITPAGSITSLGVLSLK